MRGLGSSGSGSAVRVGFSEFERCGPARGSRVGLQAGVTVNVDPRPGSVLTSTVPPWARDDGADEAQAEAETAFGPALVAAIEAFPDARQVVRRRSRCPCRRPRCARRRPSRRGADRHRAARRRVLDGVVEQVGQHLPQAIAIAGHGQARVDRRYADLDLLVFRDVLVDAHDFRDERRQGDVADGAAASCRSRPPRCPSACRASPGCARIPRGRSTSASRWASDVAGSPGPVRPRRAAASSACADRARRCRARCPCPR